MLMRKKTHRQIVEKLETHGQERFDDCVDYYKERLRQKDQELACVRGDLLVAHNEIAQLKGELMAAHHEAGKPATRARKLPPQDAPQ